MSQKSAKEVKMRKLLGVSFNRMTMQNLIGKLKSEIGKSKFTISFANPEFLMESRNNKVLETYLNSCRYTLPDGVGILWAYKFLYGIDLPERVTGTDFISEICRISEEKRFGIYLFGGKPGIAEKAREKLLDVYPKLKIVGVHDGYNWDNERIISTINKCNADILVVCLGNPLQEKWIAKNMNRLNASLLVGNGGALDFWSGMVKMAPAIIKNANLEWLFRLATNFSTKRMLRQLNLILFMLLVLYERMASRT